MENRFSEFNSASIANLEVEMDASSDEVEISRVHLNEIQDGDFVIYNEELSVVTASCFLDDEGVFGVELETLDGPEMFLIKTAMCTNQNPQVEVARIIWADC